MIDNVFLTDLLKKAKEAGFEKAEAYCVSRENFSVSVYEGEIDQYSVNALAGLSFRGLYGGKMGYAYSETADAETAEFLIERARQSAEAVENEDEQFIFGEKRDYAQIDSFSNELESVTAAQKIQACLDIEKYALEADPRIKKAEYCTVRSGSSSVSIVNTEGLDLSHRQNQFISFVVALAEDGGRMYTGYAFFAGNDFGGFSAEKMAKKAAAEALGYIGAKQADSGKYRVILRNDMTAALLGTFTPVFSADNAQKGLSLLVGKEGQKIASDALTMLDDPHMPGCIASTPFDDEGVPTAKKTLIDGGKLTTLLHNLKTAKKQGVQSTGNASKASYRSAVSVSPLHLSIVPGNDDFDDLLRRMGNGIVITQLDGLHSGANAVSGDFSLAAKGFEVKGGAVTGPVEQITLAGNFFRLLESVEAVGNDMFFDIDACAMTVPSLLISELSIAGK